MKIDGRTENGVLIVSLEGRIDMDSSPAISEFLENNISGVLSVDLDFSDVAYISSAGLRIMLWLKKRGGQRKDYIVIRNMRDTVRSVFDITGISDIVTIV